jgi:DHA1 family tetracycline resistance protein-like MFS transporter
MADDNQPALSSPLPSGAAAMRTMYFIVFLDLLGFGIIIPLLAFLVPEMNEHPLKVTALFAVYSGCQFIGAPVLGLLSDHIGRRPVLALSQAGSAVGYLLLAAAGMHWQSPITILTLLYISRIIDGFTGGNISTAQAFISDNTEPAERAKAMGMLGAAFGLGFVLGPAAGGLLGKISHSLPGFFACALSGLAAILSMITLPRTPPRGPTEAEAWLKPGRFVPILKHPITGQLMAIGFVMMCAFVTMESTMALFLNELFGWRELKVGLFFVYVGVIIVIIQGRYIGPLTRILGEWTLCGFGPLLVSLGTLGYCLTAWHAAVPLLLLSGAFNSVGRCVQMPAYSSLLSKFTRRDEQGAVFGLFHGLNSLARVVGPIAAGIAYEHFHHSGQFLMASILTLIVAVWIYFIHQPPPVQTPPPSAQPEAEAALEIT